MIDIKTLTLEEKLNILTAKNYWQINTPNNMPVFDMADGPNGLRIYEDELDWTTKLKPSNCYPSLTVVANTWDNNLAYEVGKCIADDFILENKDMVLAPGINVKRTPICGRNFEYFSEDSFLSGTLAKSYIKGIQDKGVGACVKHFCCNNREYDRCNITSNVDERTLHETYLKNFKIALEAKPWAVMTSYNKVNGVYTVENKDLINGTLRNKMGYDGVVMSDWGGGHNRYKALRAGVDLKMPYHETAFSELKNAYDKGLISIEEIDNSVNRILKMIDKNETAKLTRKSDISDAVKENLEVKVAEEGIVLLKNNGILPLKNVKTMSVYGRFSRLPAISGGGSACLDTKKEIIPLHEELAKIYNNADILYQDIFRCTESRGYMQVRDFSRSALVSYKHDAIIVVVGTDRMEEVEGKDRVDIKLQRDYEDYINCLAKYSDKVVVIIEAGSAVDVSAFEQNVASIIFTGFAGQGMNKALANIISGKVNPCGKLTETFPLSINDCYVSRDLDVTFYDDYKEGVFVGYRYYDKYNKEVRYPFGYGLSYSKFNYDNLSVEKTGESDFIVSYDIENVSSVDGYEISQVYVNDVFSILERPKKELVAYSKNFIKAGEKVRVTVNLDRKAFEFYLPPIHDFYLENGEYKIMIGASSRDIKLQKEVEINLDGDTQYSVW